MNEDDWLEAAYEDRFIIDGEPDDYYEEDDDDAEASLD